jgi:hypothetical protein
MTSLWYVPLSSFSSLNGWKSQRIAVGDSPDGRTCRLLFVEKVRHGWQSQDRIIFANREVFRISSQTIRGKKVFLFPYSTEIAHYFRRRRAEDVILSYAANASPSECADLTDFVVRTVEPNTSISYLSIKTIAMTTLQQYLADLSLAEVEIIAELLVRPALAA